MKVGLAEAILPLCILQAVIRASRRYLTSSRAVVLLLPHRKLEALKSHPFEGMLFVSMHAGSL